MPGERIDWSDSGIHWSNSSMDGELAKEWLRLVAISYEALLDSDVYHRVLELAITDLDPPRGWKLAKNLVTSSTTDQQLWSIGRNVLAHLLRTNPSMFDDELVELMKVDSRFMRTANGQMNPELIACRDRAMKPEA